MDINSWLNRPRFYAPWCGHCQNLKKPYEKAAKSLNGLAQVAAVNCDDESNKAFCGGMGVKGFPTLKIVKPSKTPGKPIVEDYQGPRTAAGIIDAVKLAIPNHVKKLSDKTLGGWLETNNQTAKAILFSDKGTTGALIKVLSTEFLESLKIAQIRNKETAAVAMFGVTDFPTIILLPGGSQEPVRYEGVFSKNALTEFFVKYSLSKPDSAHENQKPLSSKSKESAQGHSKDTKPGAEELRPEEIRPEETRPEEPAEEAIPEDAKPETAQPEQTQSAEVTSTPKPSSDPTLSEDSFPEATTIILGDPGKPTESPNPNAVPQDAPKPAAVPEPFPPIPELLEESLLRKQCLGIKTNTCLLVLLRPATGDETTSVGLASLAKLADKHVKRGSKLFPFFVVPAKNPFAVKLRGALKLGDQKEVEIIAVNSRRGWWRHYKNENLNFNAVESWVDNIRFGEGEKSKLPEELVSVEDERKEKSQEHGEL